MEFMWGKNNNERKGKEKNYKLTGFPPPHDFILLERTCSALIVPVATNFEVVGESIWGILQG